MKTGKILLRRGFTLVELMTAMAITAILVVVIMQLTNQGVDLWRSVREDVNTSTRSRAALQTMSRDFESFQMRAGDNAYEWMFAKADQAVKGAPKGMEIPRSARCVFFACAPDRNPSVSSSISLRSNYREARAHNRDTQGDVNAIGYRLMYRDQILNLPGTDKGEDGSYPLFSLYRQVISPRNTFERLLGTDKLDGAYDAFAQDDEKNFLCENILEMNLTFTVRYPSSSNEKKGASYDIVTVPIISSGNKGHRVDVYGDRIEVDGTRYPNARIVAANISITVVTEEGMMLIEQVRQKRRRAPKAADFFARYTRSFARMVNVPYPM